jgi:protein TonB
MDSAAQPAPTPQPTAQNNAGKVYEVGGNVTRPIPIYKPEPAYTKEAKAAKPEGPDTLGVVVDASGNVADVELLGSGDKGLR